jgi:predicted O-methyltransferase YrrM
MEDTVKLRQAFAIVAVAIRNMCLGGNLVSLSLARHPRRMIGYVSESLFLYKALTSKRGVLQRNVFEVLPSSDLETVTLGNLTSGENWFSPVASYTADILNLCLICRIVRPGLVFEIGTLKGYTAFHFALNTPEDARIYSLDLLRSESGQTSLHTTAIDDVHIKSHAKAERYCFESSKIAEKISCLFGDSATFDFSPFYGKVDVFFIDGAHSYEYVRSDTLNALRCCHPGSVIAWHDFGRVGVNGVSKWLVELSKTRDIFSIPGGSLAFMVIK